MKIALDAMGGDLAPKAAIEGGVAAARDFGIELVLIGDRDAIVRELADHDLSGLPVTIEHAPEIVAMDESPLESVLAKPESSIHVGLDLVKRGKVDGFVSAGNSGAVMAAAMAILGNLPGVDRPAIASMVPTTAGLALLIDAGANTDVKPLNLVQFAVMGSVYWRRVHKVSHPRVGILSNGEEAAKGTELTRSAAAALLQMAVHVHYVGYVEGRDINRAKADVVVTDGFTGNVTLKTMEGFAAFLLANLRDVFGSGFFRRLLYFLFFRRRLNTIRQRLDPAEYGGAPLLGVNGVAIVGHGSSGPRAIRNAVRAAANEALVRHVNSEIVDVLATTPVAFALKPASTKGIRRMFERMRERLYHNRDTRGARWPDVYPDKKRESPELPDREERIETLIRPERSEAPEAAAPNKREGLFEDRDNNRQKPNPESSRAEASANNRKSFDRAGLGNGTQTSAVASQDEVSDSSEKAPRPPKPI